ncbi:glycine zipper 2TM domain-containing protein [Sphingomonas sanguinis]|uniref:glycine zipper 2TM domain-containing protein n=1 Tax=Sphingomonas sanguinis TaxID=33051 RepID=UPI001C5832E4|nr:glycine zipper 2TM domain-containing protein [Sphingomonas sanguinis]QXT36222.1 glycine zipper 2TM domain-containing protein [Sphingomonas sanguinis]
MRFRRLTILAITTAVTATAIPATAQTAAQDARFRAAQARFDREYQIYRQEVDLYQSERNRGGYDDEGYSPAPPPPGPGGYRVAPPIPANGYDRNAEPYYDPVGDYRDGSQYRERVLQPQDRVYAGTDGRYYCRRPDGTTGLIIGGAAGGVLGNLVGGRSSTIATLLGAAGGALAGRSIEQNQNQFRCR